MPTLLACCTGLAPSAEVREAGPLSHFSICGCDWLIFYDHFLGLMDGKGKNLVQAWLPEF